MRISHTQLETARANPQAYRAAAANPPRFGGPSRKQYLRWAIRKNYHQTGLSSALEYLERSFPKRKFTAKSLTEYSEYLQSYHDEYVRHSSAVIEHTAFGDRIRMDIGPDCVLSGEIDRVDLTTNGYAVWLIDQNDDEWRDELRMPLLQAHYASEMGAPLGEVSVGFFFFDTATYESARFSDSEVRAAVREATNLAKALAAP